MCVCEEAGGAGGVSNMTGSVCDEWRWSLRWSRCEIAATLDERLQCNWQTRISVSALAFVT